jgi:hypothetical protein
MKVQFTFIALHPQIIVNFLVFILRSFKSSYDFELSYHAVDLQYKSLITLIGKDKYSHLKKPSAI